MIIKTNLSWNTLAAYAAMMYNNGEDPYTPTGDAFVDCVEAEDDDFVLTAAWLESDCKWQVEKHFTMLEEDFVAACHEDYKCGFRDAETVEGHNQYMQYRREANAFKRHVKAWLNAVEVVPVWEYDTDEAEFYTITANGKAVAAAHGA